MKFITKIQQIKMKELWNNKKDEIWENIEIYKKINKNMKNQKGIKRFDQRKAIKHIKNL